MKKYIFALLAIAFCTGTLFAQTPRKIFWRSNPLGQISELGPYHGWYDFDYAANWATNQWGTNTPVPGVNGDSLEFINTNSPVDRYEIYLPTAITITGNAANEGDNIRITGSYQIVFANAPITIIGNSNGIADTPRFIDLSGNDAYLEFRNPVTIQADYGSAGGDTDGLRLAMWNETNTIKFSSLTLANPVQSGTGTTNLYISSTHGQTASSRSSVSIGTLAGAVNTQLTLLSGTITLTLGNIDNFFGTLVQKHSSSTSRIIFTDNVPSNKFIYSYTRGGITLKPDAGRTITFDHAITQVTGSGGRSGWDFQGQGTVVLTKDQRADYDCSNANHNMMWVGGNAGDSIRLGGSFTLSFNAAATNQTWRGMRVDVGGGFTNEYGAIRVLGGINMIGANNHYFTFDSSNAWNTITATGRDDHWGSLNRGILLTDTAEGVLAWNAFSFSNKNNLFEDEMKLVLFNAAYGFYGTVSNDIFSIDSNWNGQLSVVTVSGNNQNLVLTVFAIPEPTTWALLGASLLVVTVLRRKKIS